jgi:hypothetical protein
VRHLICVVIFQGITSRLGRQYEMIACTNRAVFESTLPSLSGASLIVTSVLSNFLCDAGASAPDRILDVANSELTSHVQFLAQFSINNPGVQIVVVPPLARSEPMWFNPYLPCFTAYLFGEIAKTNNSQLRYLSPFVSPPSFFTADGVHLSPEAGLQFIRFIIDGVDQVFPYLGSPISVPGPVPLPHLPNPIQNLPHLSQNTDSTPVPTPSTSNFALEYSRVSSALQTLTGLTSSIQKDAKAVESRITSSLPGSRKIVTMSLTKIVRTGLPFPASTPHPPPKGPQGEEGVLYQQPSSSG